MVDDTKELRVTFFRCDSGAVVKGSQENLRHTTQGEPSEETGPADRLPIRQGSLG